MALGISERMIQRAFGAQDLSPIYNTLSAANQRIAAEDRARKVEAEKRYYTELADINKQKIGIREADIGDVTKDYNQWSAIEKQLSSNPSLITRNPEQYGKLKNEANTLYSRMLTNIQGSKEQAKEERATYQKIVDPNNLDDWDDGAGDRFKSEVLGKPISYIRQNNTDNMSLYYRKNVDGSKFYIGLQSALPAVSKYEPEVDDVTYTPKGGVKKVFKYKGLIPSIDAARSAVELEINQVGERIAPKFAQQELDKAIKSNDYDKVRVAFAEAYPKLQKQFNLPDISGNLFDENLPAKAKFINYITAKSFMSNYSNPQKTEEYKTDPIASLDYKMQLANDAQIQKENRAFSKLNKALGAGPVKITPLFEQASKGGEIGVSAMRETSKQFNQLGFGDFQMFPFTASELYQNQEGYNVGTELVASEADGNISRNVSIKNPNIEKGKEKLDKLSASMNATNKKRGFLDSDVTSEALRSGRIMILRTTDAAKNPINIYLNVNGKKSRSYMDAKIVPTQENPKEQRLRIGATLMPSVTGTAEEYGL